jgi:hypothetical protein
MPERAERVITMTKSERDTNSRMLCEETPEDIGDAALQQTGGTRDTHEPLGGSQQAGSSHLSPPGVLPASVSERRRVVRLIRRTPSSSSSAAMRRLSFDVCGCAAAALLYYWFGFWCLAVPVAVGAATVVLRQN